MACTCSGILPRREEVESQPGAHFDIHRGCSGEARRRLSPGEREQWTGVPKSYRFAKTRSRQPHQQGQACAQRFCLTTIPGGAGLSTLSYDPLSLQKESSDEPGNIIALTCGLASDFPLSAAPTPCTRKHPHLLFCNEAKNDVLDCSTSITKLVYTIFNSNHTYLVLPRLHTYLVFYLNLCICQLFFFLFYHSALFFHP